MSRQISSARLLRSAGEAPVFVSPGLPPPPPDQIGRAVLFSERGLRGTSLAIAGPVPDLDRSNFNDRTASLYIESGVWVACRDSFFRGECRSFSPGRYDNLNDFGFEGVISSVRPGGPSAVPPPASSPVPPQAGVQFFSEPDFGGERVTIERDLRELDRVGFNDRAASAVVTAGTWEMCTDAGFGGSCAVFAPGRYPRLGGLTCQVSSVRRMQ